MTLNMQSKPWVVFCIHTLEIGCRIKVISYFKYYAENRIQIVCINSRYHADHLINFFIWILLCQGALLEQFDRVTASELLKSMSGMKKTLVALTLFPLDS